MIDLTEKCKEIEAHKLEIEERLADPETVKDHELLARLSRSHRELAAVSEAFRKREQLRDRLEQAKEMGVDPDPEIVEMAAEDFGVAISSAGVLDQAETARLRQAKA